MLGCVRLHAFLCMREDRRIPRAKQSPPAHTNTRFFFDGQRCTAATLFLISSAARGSSGVSHPYQSPALPRLAYYTNTTPLFLFSLLFLCLSLINQCQAVQQQGRHSSPAYLLCFSYMSLCPDPPPPPTQRPPSSFLMDAEPKPRRTLNVVQWRCKGDTHTEKKEKKKK